MDNKSGGVSFAGLLIILFIGLKLTHYIDWSWWWVLSPIWIPLALIFIIYGFIFIGVLISGGMNLGRQRKIKYFKNRKGWE